MTYMISKEFRFEAAHSLPFLPEGHKCRNKHGHSYRVELQLRNYELNEQSMVIDYGDMEPFEEYIKNYLDHKDLNEVLMCATTAENIARHLYMIAWKLWSHVAITVRVSETARTWAEYSES